MAVLSKGITLTYTVLANGSEPQRIVELSNLMEIPELGNAVGEKIDVTVLSDEVKKSITGLSDSAQDLAFKFLFDVEQFEELVEMQGKSWFWGVSIPASAEENYTIEAAFEGTPSVKMDGAGVNAALTYTLTISVESPITFG